MGVWINLPYVQEYIGQRNKLRHFLISTLVSIDVEPLLDGGGVADVIRLENNHGEWVEISVDRFEEKSFLAFEFGSSRKDDSG